MEKETKKKREYISVSGLKGKRSWTDKMIRENLGDPDKTVPNPHYMSGPYPMKLYLLERVESVESKLDMDAIRAKKEKRKEAGKRAAETRRLRFAEKQLAWHISLPLQCCFPEEIPYDEAEANNKEILEYYEMRYLEYCMRCERRGETPKPRWRPSFDKNIPYYERHAINYLMYECTNFEDLLYDDYAHFDTIKFKILVAIGSKYPTLLNSTQLMIKKLRQLPIPN